MAIKFVQFLFPDGRPKVVEIDRPRDIEVMAKKLLNHGFKFEIENNDGQIWMTCIKRSRSHETAFDGFCKNGPEVPAVVDKIINEAFKYIS